MFPLMLHSAVVGVRKNNARTHDSPSRNLVSCREDSAVAEPHVRNRDLQAVAG